MRILLVEDDTLIRVGVQKALVRDGYNVECLDNGQHAISALETDVFDLVLLDLGLPGKDGLEVLSHVRKKHNTTPVLVLTARDTLEDKVKGLDTGADDYLIKPFELSELKARIRALLRRHHGHADVLIQLDRLTIDPKAKEVMLDGQSVVLSRREFTLLMELVNHSGQVLSKEQLENTLYGWNEEVESNSIEVHVHHLRKKLFPSLIKTVRGFGYTIHKSE